MPDYVWYWIFIVVGSCLLAWLAIRNEPPRAV